MTDVTVLEGGAIGSRAERAVDPTTDGTIEQRLAYLGQQAGLIAAALAAAFPAALGRLDEAASLPVIVNNTTFPVPVGGVYPTVTPILVPGQSAQATFDAASNLLVTHGTALLSTVDSTKSVPGGLAGAPIQVSTGAGGIQVFAGAGVIGAVYFFGANTGGDILFYDDVAVNAGSLRLTIAMGNAPPAGSAPILHNWAFSNGLLIVANWATPHLFITYRQSGLPA